MNTKKNIEDQPKNDSAKAKTTKGLKFERYFTKKGVSPYDMFKYELRTSVIKNPEGTVIFEMSNVEVPETWSQVATDILAQKYFRKAGVPQSDGSLGVETSIKQVSHRMANCWKEWGERYGYFATKEDAQIFYEEAVYSIIGQYSVPNSPQWFNTGLYSSYKIKGGPQGHYYVDPETGELKESTSAYERPQPHACFILSVDDDLVNEGGIMDLWVREARIFKYGSGVGTNYSKIRGENEHLSGGGRSSGLMSFLKIGDRAAGAIKSGGTTRRAAKMVCLDLDHPEVVDFIMWKAEEENKVAALIASGYPSDYEGEAYKTVSGQNSNNSVRIPNLFFEKLEKGEKWDLVKRTDGKMFKSIPAKELWDKISYAAWRCADPGLQFDTTINEWHTCPKGGRINASNPCSEYMFLDNTACNLASINLRKVFDETRQTFDVKGLEYLSRLWTVILEISVLMAQFPSKDVAVKSYDYRTLGLGYANLGTVLMLSGIPYDSEKATAVGGAISAIMTGVSYATCAEMAKYFGPFRKYKENRNDMLRVIRNHRYAAYNVDPKTYDNLQIKPVGINPKFCADYLLKAACNAWDKALQLGEKYGYRNAQATVIAPTGTIGLVMDCDTTGVEPDFALVKFKKLSGGGYFKIINNAVPLALKNLGYKEEEVKSIVEYAKGTGTFKNAPHINVESLKEKGFTKEEIQKLEKEVKSAFEITFVFNVWTLGEDSLKRLGFTPEKYNASDFNLLKGLNFSDEEIEKANEYICGTMTLEGAPSLKEEHLPVFDCANKCGAKGVRFIHPHGHIRMLAAVQPFISGAISKTINLPNEATIKDIQDCYALSWKLGLKANALYRDGCKLSQPLSSKSDKKNTDEKKDENNGIFKLSDLTPEQVLEAAREIIGHTEDTTFKRQLSAIVERKKLPSKRYGFTQKAKIGGQTVFVRTGEYGDGTIGEVFIDMHKEGASYRSVLNCFAIAVSIGLQYGVPLEEFVSKFVFSRFEPSGGVDHPNIKNATSVIDYLFRLLAFEYLGRNDLVQVKPSITDEKPARNKELSQGGLKVLKKTDDLPNTVRDNSSNNSSNEDKETVRKKVNVDESEGSRLLQQEYLGNLMGDAPACTVCGHITLRSGTCYKCMNCGNSMGCS